MWEKTAVSLAQDAKSGEGWVGRKTERDVGAGVGGRETDSSLISSKALFDSSLKTYGLPANALHMGSFPTVAPKIAYKQYIAT